MLRELEALFASTSSDGTVHIWEVGFPSQKGDFKLSLLQVISVGSRAMVALSLFEFSLETMACHARDLFTAFAALSWVELVLEVFLEAVWSALGQDNTFLLAAGKFIESSMLSKGSLFTKAETYMMYHVHVMVSLYLENKVHDAIKMLLMDARSEASAAAVAPWLFVFGKEEAKKVAEQKDF